MFCTLIHQNLESDDHVNATTQPSAVQPALAIPEAPADRRKTAAFPHHAGASDPSVVPFEFAISGAIVVTNTHENRSAADLRALCALCSNIMPAARLPAALDPVLLR